MTEVGKTREEKTYKYAIFHTDYYELKWSVDKAEKFIRRLHKVIDKRGDWESMLHQEIMARMKFLKSKDTSLDLAKLEYNDTVAKFAEAFIKEFNVDTTSSQETVDESLQRKAEKDNAKAE